MAENTNRWTAGRLREALAAFPDDTPIQVAVPIADEPGVVEDRYVVTELGFGRHDQHGRGEWEQDDFLTVELEDLDVD